LRRSVPPLIALHFIFFTTVTLVPALAREPLLPEVLRTEHTDFTANQERLVLADREIILQLIKLARFNIQFHQGTNIHWAWRNWLYPIAQEAGTGASLANTITDLTQRAKGLKNPNLISRSTQKQALRSAIAGNAISGGASAAELAQNAMVVVIASRHGYSPRASVAFVKNQLATIDGLLEQRQQIVNATRPGALHQTYELEGLLLEQVRDQLLLEFKRWSAHSRETMWRENTFFALDSLQNFASMGSSIVSTKGFASPWLGGSAAISGLVANSTAALNPLIKTGVGVCVRKYQRWHLSKVLPQKRPVPTEDLLAKWRDLGQRAALSPPESVDSLHIQEASFFVANSERAELVLSREQKQIEKLRQVAVQQTISGPIIGMASVARSLLSTIGYYEYRATPDVNNKLGFAGRLSQTCGQTYSMINTPVTFISQRIYTQHLRERGELPEQMLARRLTRLAEIEKEVEVAHTANPSSSDR
jgi:hypothetical protein